MKTEKMKQLMLLLLVALCFAGLNAFSQPADHEMPPHGKMGERPEKMDHAFLPNLTDDQKSQIDKLNLDFQKQTLQTRNQIGEKHAQLRTTVTQEKADLKKVDALIDDIGKLKSSIMKERVKTDLQIRALLTDEQKVLFDQRIAHSMSPDDRQMIRHRMR